MDLVERDFYTRSPEVVARELLGKKVVREYEGVLLSGMVVETEAYFGLNDSASHASRGVTPRNKVMFGPPGFSYVYFVYGMHSMLNIVTDKEGVPGAVLIRSLDPGDGKEIMQELRGGKPGLTDGPGKLCQAMGVDRSLNNWDLTRGETLWVEYFKEIPSRRIRTMPRVGIGYASPQDRAARLRFVLRS